MPGLCAAEPVPEVADRMPTHCGGVPLAPMTVMRRDYLTEILDGWLHRGIEHHHVLLDVREDELVRRVETDAMDARDAARTIAGRLAATRGWFL